MCVVLVSVLYNMDSYYIYIYYWVGIMDAILIRDSKTILYFLKISIIMQL